MDLNEKENVIKGAIYGFLVGDAIAIHYRLTNKAYTDMGTIDMYPGPGLREQGTYTNTSALMLAEMASISEFGALNYDDIMERFQDTLIAGYLNWDQEDENGDTGNYFMGETSSQSIKNYSNGFPYDKCGLTEANDDEGLMRMLPIALYFIDDDIQTFIKKCHTVAKITHNNTHNQVCSTLYSGIIRNILLGKTERIFDIIEEQYANMPEHLSALQDIKKRSDEKYAMGTDVTSSFWMAWKIFAQNSDNYRSAIARSVRLLGNSNVMASIVGSLVGISQGVSIIPDNWIRNLKVSYEATDVIEAFTRKILKKIASNKELSYNH